MNLITILILFGCALGAYLIGSVSFAYIIGKIIIRRDIRKYGSGNAGASNMTRNFGWKLGLITFIGDILKGSIAVLLGKLAAGNAGMCIAAVCVVAGHDWPVFFGFRGGKGAATTLGAAFVILPPLEAAVILAVSVIIIAVFRFVSLGSIIGAVLMIADTLIFHTDNIPLVICVVVLFLIVVVSHRENIGRLIKGTERKISFGKGRPRKIKKEKENKNSIKTL